MRLNRTFALSFSEVITKDIERHEKNISAFTTEKKE